MTTLDTKPSQSSAPASGSPARWSPAKIALLLTLSTVLALDGLDVSMVGVALPSIGHELALNTENLQWIVSGYVLGYGGLLLLGGRLSDLLGRRKMFLIALTVFALASALGGLVSDPTLLIATRFIKGLSAAFTAPAGFSLITTNFPEGPQRNRAISIYSMFGASGFSLGLVVGGLMTSLSWRWTFLASAPLALLTLIIGLIIIPKDKPEEEGGQDLGGAVTLALGMLTLVYTVVSAPDRGWTSPLTIGGFALAVVLLAAFGLIERKVKHPLIRFGILREGSVARANLAIIGLFGSYLSFQFILTMYLQNVLGWSPLSMALALLPTGLIVMANSPFASRLIDKVGTSRLIIVGLLALSLGYLLFLRVGTDLNYPLDVLPSVILLGIGFGLGFPAINVQATEGIANHEQGLAAGLIQTSAQVGAALILAITTAIVAVGSSHLGGGTPGAAAMLEVFRPGLIFCAVIAVLALLVVAVPKSALRVLRVSR